MSIIHLSEIFPLTYNKLNIASFRLSPSTDKKLGNSLGWHLSQRFPGVVAIWEGGNFWVLAQPNQQIPATEDWQVALEDVQNRLKERSDDLSKTAASLTSRFIQWVNEPTASPSVIAQLAVRALKINCRFSSKNVDDLQGIKVQIECNFWAENIALNEQETAAISLNLRSPFLYKESLEHFFNNHPYRNDPETLLTDLLVRDIDTNSTGTITGINGVISEHKDRLLKQAKGAVSQEKLQIAPDDQPVVKIQFGKNSYSYDYAMAALRPCITPKTASKFNVEYGQLLRKSKIPYAKRQELLSIYKQEADKTLSDFGLKLAKRCVNSRGNGEMFTIPENELEETVLLFGKGVKYKKSQTLSGLSRGGVYCRHPKFNNPQIPIRIASLNLTSSRANPLFDSLVLQLNKYGFSIKRPDENVRKASLEGLSQTEARAKVQSLLDEIVVVPPDLVLVFLPESDRGGDDSDGESIYSWVSSRLLRRKIASQVIYEKTMNGDIRNILNQVVPGILAKLGNLPFVLAEPLSIADYFIGLDISRKKKKNGTGTVNACACVRIYGKQGEFIRYQLASESSTEGEEIPAKILQDFLPSQDFKGKIVLIYRDGLFRGDEVKNIVDWGAAIGCQFILVECAKSQVPRLYNLFTEQVNGKRGKQGNSKLQAPTRGLALKLSSREVILVTTRVNENIGVPRTLRLKVRDEGLSTDINTLVETTLKLTLLHHGSLKDPRLPIPLFGADRIAYRRLQGIYPGELEGNIQYWL